MEIELTYPIYIRCISPKRAIHADFYIKVTQSKPIKRIVIKNGIHPISYMFELTPKTVPRMENNIYTFKDYMAFLHHAFDVVKILTTDEINELFLENL